MGRAFQFTVFIWLCLATSILFANENGVTWLANQQQNNGSFVSGVQVTDSYQSTSETIELFDFLEIDAPNTINAAASFLEQDQLLDTERLARLIKAKHTANQSTQTLIAQLITRQNEDGGFADRTQGNSSPYATAFSLFALSTVANDYSEQIAQALTYLESQQNDNGSFHFWPSTQSPLMLTAMISHLLQALPFEAETSVVLDAASNYLSLNKNPQDYWEDSLTTAWALLALIPRTQQPIEILPSAQWLKNQQQANGSWQNEAYITAVALHAFFLASQQFSPPQEGVSSLFGRVVDVDNQAPLDNVLIQLDGPTQDEFITNYSGQFNFSQVEPGDYEITYSKAGYQTQIQQINVQPDFMINLGDIALPLLPNTGLIQGKITDSESSDPIAQATIQITGAINIELQSDENGSFAIESPPGNVSIQISKNGYYPVAGQGEVKAGQILLFSPAMVPDNLDPVVGVVIKGKVLKDQTLTPINAVSIKELNSNLATSTNAQGEFYLDGLAAGTLNIEITKPGYNGVAIEAVAADNTILNLGNIILTPQEALTSSSLSGQVFDSVTELPLAGATVTLLNTNQVVNTDNEGNFSLVDINEAQITVKVEADQYISQEYDFQLPQIGIYQTSMYLYKPQLPDSGLIKGQITDSETDNPIVGATVEITGALNDIIATDNDGKFAVESPAGSVNVKISAAGYHAVVGSDEVNIGDTLWFIAALLPDNLDPIIGAAIQGNVIDGETLQPLSDVNVHETINDLSITSDGAGDFYLDGLAAGDQNITITKSGYSGVMIDANIPDGAILDLETINLMPQPGLTSSTLLGAVLDAQTQQPIVGAEVTLAAQDLQQLTDDNGAFNFTEILAEQVTLKVTAAGYLDKISQYQIPNFGVYQVEVHLDEPSSSEVVITDAEVEQALIAPFSEIEAEVYLLNTGDEARYVRMFYKVYNPLDELIVEAPTVLIPAGGDPYDAYVLLEPNIETETEVEWHNHRYEAGIYDFVIQVVDPFTNELLDQATVEFEIEAKQQIGGGAVFDPPISVLAENEEVAITANISDRGNVLIGPSTAKATVTLLNPGYPKAKTSAEITTIIEQDFSYPYGIARDDEGNIYVAQYNNHLVMKVTPEGEQSIFLENISYPIDVTFDTQGNLYVVCSHNYNNQSNLYRVKPNLEIEEWKTTIPSQSSVLVLPNNRILIGSNNGLYEFFENDDPVLLVGKDLATPKNVVTNSQGDVFIADSTIGAIFKYSTEGILTTFTTDLKSPYGMTIGLDDHLYVTDFGTNSLLRIKPDAEIITITAALQGPKDVVWYDATHLLVSNSNAHEIVTVSLGGVIEIVASSPVRNPQDVLVENDESYLIPKGGEIWRFYNNSIKSELVATVPGTIYSLTRRAADNTIFARASSYIYQIDDNNQVSKVNDDPISGLKKIHYSESQQLLYASVNYSYENKVISIDENNVINTAAHNKFSTPGNLTKDNDGNILIVDYYGYLNIIDPSLSVKLVDLDVTYTYGSVLEANGDLLFADYYGKALKRRLQGGTIEIVKEFDFYPGGIAKGPNDEIFIAQWGGKELYVYDEQQDTLTEWAVSDYNIYQLTTDTLGNLWVSHRSNHKVSVFKGGELIRQYDSILNAEAVTPDNADGALVAARGKVYQLHPDGTSSEWLAPPELNGVYFRDFVVDNNNVLWVISYQGKIYQFNDQQEIINRYAPLDSIDPLTVLDSGEILASNVSGKNIVSVLPGNKLPKVELDTYYKNILRITDNEFLLNENGTKIKRFYRDNGIVEDVIGSGIGSITGLGRFPNGNMVLVDYSKSQVSQFTADGELLDQFTGIATPNALLLDQEQNIIASTAQPVGAVKIKPGKHPEYFINGSGINDLWLEEDGTILVARSHYMYHYDTGGSQLDYFYFPAVQGIYRDSQNQLWATSSNSNDGGLYQVHEDETYTRMTSGINRVTDLASDSAGDVFIADRIRGNVQQLVDDNALSLYLDGIPQVRAIGFNQDDTLLAFYNNLQLASFDQQDFRQDYHLNNLFSGYFYGIAPTSTGAIAARYGPGNDNGLYDLVFGLEDIVINPGDILYEAMVDIPALVPDIPQPVDFGAWVPPISGDFQVTVELLDENVEGQLVNTLHVGNAALANFVANQTFLVPGNQAVSGAISLVGADTTSITQIDTEATSIVANSGANGRGIAGDSQGNIYVVDTSRIVKVDTEGIVTDFVTNLSVKEGIVIGPDDTIYGRDGNNIIYAISPQAEVTVFLEMPSKVNALAIGPDDLLYAVDTNKLYRIFPDQTFEVVADSGINNPRGLTIDAFGNYYILGYSNSVITRIKPNGSFSIWFDEAKFEYEGVNVIADCSNNLMFAPIKLEPFKAGGEETMIIQLVGATKEPMMIFDGPPVDAALADIDVLYYDRYGDRLLMWTDYNSGKVFSFPVICGGIDVALSVTSRTDVDFTSIEPQPTSIEELEDGRFHYYWEEISTDNQGVELAINFMVHNLAENETRPLADEAYIEFTNSFKPNEVVTVPITIPTVTAESLVDVTPTTDKPSYYSFENAELAAHVFNDNDIAFNGSTILRIFDDEDELVKEFAAIDINGLSAQSSDAYSLNWNTEAVIAGTYWLEAELFNSQDLPVAINRVSFEIVAGDGDNPFISGLVTTDKPIYQAWDQALIEGQLGNNAENASVDLSIAKLAVFDPGDQLIYEALSTPFILPPGSVRDIDANLNLVDAKEGDYVVTLTLHDAENDEELYQTSTVFAVVRPSTASLIGQVQVKEPIVVVGESNQCDETANNLAQTAVNGIVLQHRLLAMATEQVVTSDDVLVNIQANDSYQQQKLIDTQNLMPGAYVCQLLAKSGNETKLLGAAGFTVVDRTQIGFAVDNYKVSEAASTMTVNVSRLFNHWGEVSVDYELTNGGNAQAGQDFSVANGTLQWGHLDQSDKTINVTIHNDDLAEGDENFYLQLTAINGYADIGANDKAEIIILDDDVPGITVLPSNNVKTSEQGQSAQFMVVLNSQPTHTVTVPISATDVTESINQEVLVSFEPENWNQPQLVNLAGVDDAIADGDIASEVTVGVANSNDPIYQNMDAPNVWVTNLDDDTPGIVLIGTENLKTSEQGTQTSFSAILLSEPQSTVIINFTSSNLAETIVTSDSLVFDANNWNQPQLIKLMGMDDVKQDGDIDVEINANVVSEDLAYHAMVLPLVDVINQDDDIAGITISGEPYITSEDGDQATIMVSLHTEPLNPVQINFAVMDHTEGHMPINNITIQPENWQTDYLVAIDGVDDYLIDGDIDYTVEVSSQSDDINYHELTLLVLPAVNLDNDVSPPGSPAQGEATPIPINRWSMLLLILLLSSMAYLVFAVRRRQ